LKINRPGWITRLIGRLVGKSAVVPTKVRSKQVVGVRLNQAGMRWNLDHAVAVAHVRAKILSGRWDEFWDTMVVNFDDDPMKLNRV
jgi:hypothetical protein